MAEAFTLGATVVSVVGFAGQVLQGCAVVRAFLDDLKDAPGYIEDLKSIIVVFEASLTSLKSTLSEDNASAELRPALEYSDKCIRDLEETIRKLRDEGPGWKRNLSAVRWKSKIVKQVENLKTARALLTGVQMNRANSGLRVDDPSKNGSPRTGFANSDRCSGIEGFGRKGAQNGGSWPCIAYRSATTPKSKETCVYEVSLIRGWSEKVYYAPAVPSRIGKCAEGFNVDFVGMRPDFQEDLDFKFGYCDYLPGDYVEMAKDTIRGVLLDYGLEDFLSSDPKGKGMLCMNAPQINIVQKHQGIFRTRGVQDREVKERQFQRGLGLVTITRTTTKWRTNRIDNSFYLETKLHISLDPKSDPFIRLRLFCVTVFDGASRYEPSFDPVLKVCNWVRYDAPIIAACRNGDLDQVRTLFASGLASPYDRFQTRCDMSLLDVVFRQIVLNLDQPANSSMSRLCRVFKYLVGQDLDPAELSEQYEHTTHPHRRRVSDLHYTLSCSYCFEAIKGRYYDCKFGTCGDFSLCQRCIETGQRCMDPEHFMQQPLQERADLIERPMRPYTPLERLASVYYTQEYAPYLVEIARIILCRSTQDPLSNNFGRFIEWRWYKEHLGLESPVLSFISRQQEWMFEWKDETFAYQAFRIELTTEHLLRDPTASVLRTHLRATCFESHWKNLDFIAYTLAKLRNFFYKREFREVVINHIAACIDSNTYFVHQLLLPTLTEVLRRFDRIHLLDEALNRCDHLDRLGVYHQAPESLSPKYISDCFDLVFDSIREHFDLED
ncbi:hypothetical protein EG329_002083 [Mollisiaceae sp. DMI_Dod_QoI]|nr:hypothetical protein EG329_002083 [Helotiales sp. DMI_Dod_QoI]